MSLSGKPVAQDSFTDKNSDSSPEREEDGDDKVSKVFFSSTQLQAYITAPAVFLCCLLFSSFAVFSYSLSDETSD